MKIKTKLLLAFLIIASIPLLATSVVSYYTAKNALTSQVLSHLESVAEIQRNRIESIYEQNLERLNLVSSRTQLRVSLDSFIVNPNTDDRDRMNQILLDARASISSFRDISVLTLDGKVVASTDATKIGSIHLTDETFMRGQNEDTADIFFLDESQDLGIYLSGPLYMEDELLGVVVIESTGDSIITAINDYTGLGATGETQLAEVDANGGALFIAPTRFGQNAPLSLIVPKEEVSSPIIQALSKNEELVTEAIDYRGEPVLAATQYIPETGWGLVTKIDRAEALASVSRLEYLLPTICLLSLAFVLLVSLLLSRAIAHPVMKLARMATRVSEGDLSSRAEITSKDEIGMLAEACNKMKDSLVKTNSDLEQELAERKKAEEKYTMLVERSNDGIIIVQDGLVKFANSKMIKMTGFSLEEATGKPFIEFVSPEYKAPVMENYRRRVSGEATPNNYEIEILTKDGNLMPVEINASRIEYEKRSADMAIVRNITERKQAEDRLQEERDKAQRYLEVANVIFIVIQANQQVSLINRKGCEVLGYKEKEIIGKNWFDSFIPKRLRNEVKTVFDKLVKGDIEPVEYFENPVTTKSGEEKIIAWHNTILTDEAGNIIGALSSGEDITERKQAEAALRQSEERYRDLFDNANDLIQSVSPDGHFLYTNKAWRKALGYNKKEVANLKVSDVIHTDSRDHCMETFQKVMSGDNVRDIEAVFVAKNGDFIDVEGNAHSRFVDGKSVSTQGIFRDVTARRKAEERIVHLNSLLRALRDINQLITRESVKERIIQESCDILVRARGYEKAWILLVDENKNPLSIVGAGLGGDSGAFMEQMRKGIYPDCVRRLWHQKKPFVIYNNPGVRHKSCILAGRHSVRAVYRCRLEYEGNIYGMLGVTIPSQALSDEEEKELFLELCGDISFALAAIEKEERRRRMEEELRRSETRLAEAQRMAHIGSWDWDIPKNEISYSNEFHRMFGRRISTLEAFLDSLHPDDRESVEKSINEALYKDKPYDREYRVILPNAEERVIYAKGEVTFDDTDRPLWMAGTVQDITERKKMEEQLILTDRLASVGELASGIAHELNNPLTGVIGLSQLLIQRRVPKDIKEDLSLVHSEAQRAANVVKNLLTFARKHPPAKQPLSINEVINKVLEIRAYEERVRNVEVVTHLAPDLPKIMGDYFQLQQVFLNIVINAEFFVLKAHGKGTLTVTTRKRGDVVQASLADDGPGITKEDLGHIFDPFFTTKEVGKGTGLGLSICHGIITAHNGRIYAESKPGKGATFIIELPLEPEEPTLDQPKNVPKEALSGIMR
jgi:PAS domain S-box-containing protein